MYLGSTLYRIHGSNEPETIGQAVSSGCFRMTNDDVTDLYESRFRRHHRGREELGARPRSTAMPACGSRDHALRATRRLLAASFAMSRSRRFSLHSRSRGRSADHRVRQRCLAAGRIGRNPRHRLAPARREEDLHRQRDHRRIFQDRLRRRISSGRPGRPHPEIRHAGAGVRRRQPRPTARRSSQRSSPTSAQRVQHLDIAMADNSDSANVLVKLVRDRDLYRTITTFYGSERAQARSGPRSIRNACPAFARTRSTRSSIPTSSSPSTMAISSSSIAPMRNCCSRWGRSTIPLRCPGPCSTTMCRWVFSTSTTSTS